MAKSKAFFPFYSAMNAPFLIRALTVVAMLSMTSTVLAQYAWIDAKGVRQYSDQPPPADIPQSRILKMPGRIDASDQTLMDTQPNRETSSASTADKNADFLRRQAKQLEKEKKASEEASLAATKAKNCERARDYQRMLNSGQRIASADTSGERRYLSDEERAREAQDTRRILSECQ